MKPRPVLRSDFADVLALNDESVHFLSALDADRLVELDRMSALHLAIEDEGRVAAFLLAFREGVAYDSVNYQWFARRYSRFLYIDRVVVSGRRQSKGAGTLLYQYVFEHALENAVPIVACEFDVEPPNAVSERFHARFGFEEVGRQCVAQGRKIVSLQTSAVRIHRPP